jgi:DNA-binding NarL/FixJ family response regulator
MSRPASPHAVRVLIVDDHRLLRQSLAALLSTRPEVEVVGDCSDGHQAVVLAEQLAPDVVLMDLSMPNLNGIAATRQVRERCPKTRVIIVSASADLGQLTGAVLAGASGYVIKRSDIDELVTAIRLVRRGNTYFSEDLASEVDIPRLIAEARAAEPRMSRLTSREEEVLQLVAEGRTGREIAEQLVISPKTVESHVANLLAKFGARNRVDLVRAAVQQGILVLDAEGRPGRAAS